MRIELRDHGVVRELYVNGALARESNGLDLEEAFTAIGDVCPEVGFQKVQVNPAGRVSLFGDLSC